MARRGHALPEALALANTARVVTSLDRPVGDARDATLGDPLLARVRELQGLSGAA